MKTLITTLALLGLFINAALADAPEPTLAERAQLVHDGWVAVIPADLYDTPQERSAALRAYWVTDPAIAQLADDVVAYSGQEELGQVARSMAYNYGQYRYLRDETGQWTITPSSVSSATPYLQMYPTGIWTIRLLTAPEDIVSELGGDPAQLGNVYWMATRRDDVDRSVYDGYIASLVGKGSSHSHFQRFFRGHIKDLTIEQAIPALAAEIRAVLAQPQSDERDKWLVELRGQLKVLQELQ